LAVLAILQSFGTVEAQPRLLLSAKPLEDLAPRAPRHGEAGVRVQQSLVVPQGLEETWVRLARRFRGLGLAPARRQEGQIALRLEDVQDLKAVLRVLCGLELRGLRKGFRSLDRAPHLREDSAPLRPDPREARVGLKELLALLEFLLEPLHLRLRRRLADPLPSVQELLTEPMAVAAVGGRLRDFEAGSATDEAFPLAFREVRTATVARAGGMIGDATEAGQEGNLPGCVFPAADVASRVARRHHGAAARAQDPWGFLCEKCIDGLHRGGLFIKRDAAEGTARRLETRKGTALGAEEQVAFGIPAPSRAGKTAEDLHVGGGEPFDRLQFLGRGRAEVLEGGEALHHPTRLLRREAGEETQPIEVALVHRRRCGWHPLIKGLYASYQGE